MNKELFSVIQIAKRTPDGGITPIALGLDCNICNGIYKEKKYITHIVRLRNNRLNEEINICKTCLCEALKEIDKRIMED